MTTVNADWLAIAVANVLVPVKLAVSVAVAVMLALGSTKNAVSSAKSVLKCNSKSTSVLELFQACVGTENVVVLGAVIN